MWNTSPREISLSLLIILSRLLSLSLWIVPMQEILAAPWVMDNVAD